MPASLASAQGMYHKWHQSQVQPPKRSQILLRVSSGKITPGEDHWQRVLGNWALSSQPRNQAKCHRSGSFILMLGLLFLLPLGKLAAGEGHRTPGDPPQTQRWPRRHGPDTALFSCCVSVPTSGVSSPNTVSAGASLAHWGVY